MPDRFPRLFADRSSTLLHGLQDGVRVLTGGAILGIDNQEGGALAQAHGGTKTAFGVHLAIEIADESIPGTRRLVLRLLSGHFGSKEGP